MEVRFIPDSDREKISDADVYGLKEYLGRPHLILPRAGQGGLRGTLCLEAKGANASSRKVQPGYKSVLAVKLNVARKGR